MRLRPPSNPIITVDPYFSVWSPTDVLTDSVTVHWTGRCNTLTAYAEIDGESYRFMGRMHGGDDSPALAQVKKNVTALSSEYVFEGAGIRLTAVFTTPLLMDDFDTMSRPVSYLRTDVRSVDGREHNVKITVKASEEFCLNLRGEDSVEISEISGENYVGMKMGSARQPVLAVSGDDIRINWGYFCLTSGDRGAHTFTETISVPFTPRHRGENAPDGFKDEMTFVGVACEKSAAKCASFLFAFAYDDVRSLEYFGDHLTSYWNRNGKIIEAAIGEAYLEYDALAKKCGEFSDKLFTDAVRAGGEKYAEICELSYRQSIAAHKLCVDTDGNIIFVSKECFSNGCAATADVSYPSIPLYLLCRPELVRGMMRPIFKYARTPGWIFDFAPHDCGQYPLVHGQVYNGNHIEGQMPVEECGNMIVMAAAEAVASGDASFAGENLDLLEKWVRYLDEHGDDPENQLCTDDFAGHLAHNCNLSLKAVMGIAGLGVIYSMLGRDDDASRMEKRAREMAESWISRAANGDGSYRLAFNKPGTWSMKYNIVWDKLMHTGIMPEDVLASEFASYRKHINAYGMPLDNREMYTKSDWAIWTATLAAEREDFEEFVAPVWRSYNDSYSRVPLTDWYNTVTATQIGFQHRSVVGGHFMKMLEYSGKMNVKK